MKILANELKAIARDHERHAEERQAEIKRKAMERVYNRVIEMAKFGSDHYSLHCTELQLNPKKEFRYGPTLSAQDVQAIFPDCQVTESFYEDPYGRKMSPRFNESPQYIKVCWGG